MKRLAILMTLFALPAFAQTQPQQPDYLSEAVTATGGDLTALIVQWRIRAKHAEDQVTVLQAENKTLQEQLAAAKAASPKAAETVKAPAPVH